MDPGEGGEDTGWSGEWVREACDQAELRDGECLF